MDFNKNSGIVNIDLECTPCKKLRQAEGRIDVSRVIEKLDACFDKDDLSGAVRLLEYWQREAASLGDSSGELSLVNEMLGLFRKTQSKEKAAAAVKRALELIELTDMSSSVSGATIMINAATTQKAFGNADAALPLYARAEEIYKLRGLPKDDLKYAALYNNHATALVDLARFDEALSLYKKAISLTESSLESLLDCAITYVNMAHLFEARDGFDSPEIDKHLKIAEGILENGRIPRDSYYAFVCQKCAPSFDHFGHFVFAKILEKTSREIYERA